MCALAHTVMMCAPSHTVMMCALAHAVIIRVVCAEATEGDAALLDHVTPALTPKSSYTRISLPAPHYTIPSATGTPHAHPLQDPLHDPHHDPHHDPLHDPLQDDPNAHPRRDGVPDPPAPSGRSPRKAFSIYDPLVPTFAPTDRAEPAEEAEGPRAEQAEEEEEKHMFRRNRGEEEEEEEEDDGCLSLSSDSAESEVRALALRVIGGIC